MLWRIEETELLTIKGRAYQRIVATPETPREGDDDPQPMIFHHPTKYWQYTAGEVVDVKVKP